LTSNISLEEAVAISCANINVLGCEHIHINDAFMRVSADNIVSFIDIPSFDRSSMDGYAIGRADLEILNTGNSLSLQVTDIIQAGSIESKQIRAGETFKIMTGALVPEGSAAVIKQEDVKFYINRNIITACGSQKQGENICQTGQELKAGDQVASKGQLLTGEVLERIAACGIDKINVYKKPRVSVIDTGSELLLPGSHIKKGQIYASSRSLLSGKIKGAGAIPLLSDCIVEDDLQVIANEIEKAAMVSDMVIITGGTGKGVYDLVYKTFEYLNAKPLFRGINIIPGKGASVVLFNGKILFNVSGNPCAAGLLFEVLIKPALQKLSGDLFSSQKWFDIKLGCPLKVVKPVRNLCQGEMIFEQGSIYAQPINKNSNHIINNPLILDIQAGQGATGDMVKAKLI